MLPAIDELPLYGPPPREQVHVVEVVEVERERRDHQRRDRDEEQRQRDAPEDLPGAAAVDARGLGQLVRDRLQRAERDEEEVRASSARR